MSDVLISRLANCRAMAAGRLPAPDVETIDLAIAEIRRRPLSQDAILDFAEGCTLQFHDLLEFARKVERAHGIGA